MTTEKLTPHSRAVMALTGDPGRAKMQRYLHGSGLSPVKYEQIALALLNDPKIVNCDPNTIVKAIAGAAQLGLQFIAGQAYVVPFKGKAQLIVGYQGFVNLMKNAGYSTFADVVYKGDEFDYWVDSGGQQFKHRRTSKPEDRIDPNITHSYAIATYVNQGEKLTTVMVLERFEIDKIRNSSRASRDDSPWKVWFAEMAKKSAIRRLAKLCAKDTNVAKAIEYEDRAERGEDIDDLIDVTPPDRDSEPRDVEPFQRVPLDDEDIPGVRR